MATRSIYGWIMAEACPKYGSAKEDSMFDRKQTVAETDARTTPAASDRLRDDSFRPESVPGYSQWNSWGERNSLSLGSYGRW